MTGFARAEEAFGNLQRSIGGYAARFVQQQDTADLALDAQWPRDSTFNMPNESECGGETEN